jgi:hypothetical protein
VLMEKEQDIQKHMYLINIPLGLKHRLHISHMCVKRAWLKEQSNI